MKITQTQNQFIKTDYSAEEILSEMSNLNREDSRMRYDVFTANAPVWKKYTGKVQNRLLDIISNTLFYFPLPKNLIYTRKISLAALLDFLEKGKSGTNEHFWPRKETTKLFFQKILNGKLSFERFLETYINRYGRYHIVTARENRFLQKGYERKEYRTWEEAYEDQDIILLDDPTHGTIMTKKRRHALAEVLRREIPKLGEKARELYIEKQERFQSLIQDFFEDRELEQLPESGEGSIGLTKDGHLIENDLIPIHFIERKKNQNIYYFTKTISEKSSSGSKQNHFEEVIEFLERAAENAGMQQTDRFGNSDEYFLNEGNSQTIQNDIYDQFVAVCEGKYFQENRKKLKSHTSENVMVQII